MITYVMWMIFSIELSKSMICLRPMFVHESSPVTIFFTLRSRDIPASTAEPANGGPACGEGPRDVADEGWRK